MYNDSVFKCINVYSFTFKIICIYSNKNSCIVFLHLLEILFVGIFLEFWTNKIGEEYLNYPSVSLLFYINFSKELCSSKHDAKFDLYNDNYTAKIKGKGSLKGSVNKTETWS